MPVDEPGGAEGHTPQTYKIRVAAMLALVLRSDTRSLTTSELHAEVPWCTRDQLRYALLTLAHEGYITHFVRPSKPPITVWSVAMR